LRDDFISVVVRGCWLVSFFFTPIYMFILSFIVMFNIKKGALVVYKSGWSSLLSKQIHNIYYNFNSLNKLNKYYMYRFHFTSITSRTTSYLLFFFWVFFFFFGEVLLLLTFNYITPVDSITSHSFFIIKQHVIFLTESLTSKLTNSINFYIYLLTSFSIIYLINLNLHVSYNFFVQSIVSSVLPFFIFIIFII
jgi:hypothetical protein